MSDINQLSQLSYNFVQRMASSHLLQAIKHRQINAENFRPFLQMMFHFVRSSSETLIMAAAASKDIRIRNYLYEHAVEEQGHEKMILNDFVALGGDGVSLSRSFPLPLCQGYISHFRNAGTRTAPEERLGATFVIEHMGKELGPGAYQGLLACGITKQQLSFVSSHGILDEGHANDILELVKSSDLDTQLLGNIESGARFATKSYFSLYEASFAEASLFTRPYTTPQSYDNMKTLQTSIENTCHMILEQLERDCLLIKELNDRIIQRSTWSSYLKCVAQWLPYVQISQCVLAMRLDTRWSGFREILWVDNVQGKEDLQNVNEDLQDLGEVFTQKHFQLPNYWISLFIDYLYDSSDRAPMQRLGFMLFANYVEEWLCEKLAIIDQRVLNSEDVSQSRYLKAFLLKQRNLKNKKRWIINSNFTFTGSEQSELHYGIIVGGYFYKMMLQSSNEGV